MTDPMQRIANKPEGSGISGLFDSHKSTSDKAAEQANSNAGIMRQRILDRLRKSPAALFEVAAELGVPDHIISGRFTDLSRDMWIERTGVRRTKPETGCEADVWRICRDAPAAPDGVIEKLGYPSSVKIEGDLFDRQELLPHEVLPGIPYCRRADNGGARLAVRLSLIECEGCGKPLKLVIERDVGPAGVKERKLYRCGTPGCHRTWRPVIAQEPGQVQLLAMIMETM